MYTSPCAMSDLKKKASYVPNLIRDLKMHIILEDITAPKKRKRQFTNKVVFFSRQLRNYEKTCCTMSRQPAETFETCGKKILSKEIIKKRTPQEHAEKHGPTLCKLTESVHE